VEQGKRLASAAFGNQARPEFELLKGIMDFVSTLKDAWLRKIVNRIEKKCPQELPSKSDLLAMHFAWGNIGFMASLSYLQRITRAVRETRGPILECGSGLTTILMGIMTRGQGIQIYSLEHHEVWQKRMRSVIETYDLKDVHIIDAPLQNFGEYDWYSFEKSIVPSEIDLVVCDGPPGNIRGSRYGLIPEMNPYLSNSCNILLDDANRRNEKAVMENWRTRHGFRYELEGVFHKFALVNRVSS